MIKQRFIIGIIALTAASILSRLAVNYLLQETNKPYCTKCGKDLIHRTGWYCPHCDIKY